MKLALALVFLLACGNKKDAPTVTPPPQPLHGSAGSATVAGSGSAAPAPAAPLDLPGMDTAVKPGDDFFAYANGAWMAKTEIPADRANFGAGAITAERTEQRVRELIEDAAHAAAGTEARKIGDYYATFMDEATIASKGLAPLQPDLDRIAAIADPKQLAHAIGETLRADVDVLNATNFETANLFGVWIAQDLSDPAKYSPFLLQGGLGMPSRDFYIDPSPRMAAIRAKYVTHVAAMLALAKLPDTEAAAKRIVDLETQIAKVHATRVESEDVKHGLTHWSRKDFDTKAPGLDWGSVFEGAHLDKQTDFVVWHPHATTGISAIAKSVPLATWKEYLAFHAIEQAGTFMPKPFVDELFAFYGTTITGTPTLRERWKRGVAATDAALGEAIGKLYVAKYFPAAARDKIRGLVKNILAAFDRRIEGLAWMAPATKAKAKAKLAALKVGVGYPDKWRDYSGLDVQKGDALGNAKRARLFEYQRNLAKLGTPVDRDEWVMNPQLVDAVNLPAMNALNFPAAILQPPFFDPSRPEAMDYGSVGAVIGHEISHSFDDQGAQFDETGKLQNWWTPADFDHFKTQGAALVKEFDAYKPFPDLAVNGKQTLSENIADVAGLAAAYDAFQISLAGKPAPAWQSLNGDQQFFLSFGQSWRTKTREPALRRQILTDGHAPGEFRADTVRNIDAWYAAFDVKPTDKLYLAPPARVRVW